MVKNSPLVSIVFPNWNGGEKTINCLDSIYALDYPNFEVIMVDNFSQDGSKEDVQKKFLKVQIIENSENKGCVKALNQGFNLAKGDFILRLDNDIILDKNLLTELVKEILSKEDIGVVFPKIYYHSEPKRFDNLGFSVNLFTSKSSSDRIDKIDKGQFEKKTIVECIPGSVLLARKEVIQKTGGIDENYFLFYEDADWCLRVAQSGYKIAYVPTTKSWHDCNKKEINPFKMYHYMRSKMIFIKKNGKFYHKFVFFPLLFFFYVPLSVMRYFFNKKKRFLIKPFFKGLFNGLFHKISK